jgi:hypothetical protein
MRPAHRELVARTVAPGGREFRVLRVRTNQPRRRASCEFGCTGWVDSVLPEGLWLGRWCGDAVPLTGCGFWASRNLESPASVAGWMPAAFPIRRVVPVIGTAPIRPASGPWATIAFPIS